MNFNNQKRQPSFIDLSGREFGLWSVLSYAGNSRWNCRCKCGVERPVTSYTLRSGKTSGCVKCKTKRKHGLWGTKEFESWQAMMTRCYNTSHVAYKDYGGRGIVVCNEWHDARNFVRDMGNRPDGFSLDRIDTNGQYCKENCRWASSKQQGNNRRNNRIVDYQGTNYTASNLARHLGIKYTTLLRRIKHGGQLDAELRYKY